MFANLCSKRPILAPRGEPLPEEKEEQNRPSVRGSLSGENHRSRGISGGMSFLFNEEDLIGDAMTYELVERYVADDLVIEFGRLIFAEKSSFPKMVVGK